eukprot:15198663-Alexandrium_andersonii.AAC.1
MQGVTPGARPGCHPTATACDFGARTAGSDSGERVWCKRRRRDRAWGTVPARGARGSNSRTRC